MKKNRKKKIGSLLTILAGTALLLAGCETKGDQTAADSSRGSASAPEEETVQQITGQIREPEKEPFTMFFTGDIQMGSNITSAYDRMGLDGIIDTALLEEMRGADITMVNEEFPFGTGGEPAPDKQFTFRTDPSYVKALNEMGVDIVSLANNHVLDFGQDVLSQTFDTLDQADIAYVGAGESLERAGAWQTLETKGTKVAFLSASRVIPVVGWDVRNSQPGVFTTYDPSLLIEQIKKADQENDLVVVYVHWGIEKAQMPEEYQRTMARQYIDAGADLVIGSHPHVLQGVEYYKGVPVVYSLGNFMFNDTIDQTAALKVEADEEGQLTLQFLPAAASASKTSGLTGDRAAAVLDHLQSISFGARIDENGYVSPEDPA